MFKPKKSRKVNLPHRQPTEFERFRAFVRHEEREASRRGQETFAESIDFDVPEDPDPLEHFFSTPTHHEGVHNVGEMLCIQPDGSVRIADSYRSHLAETEEEPAPQEAGALPSPDGDIQPELDLETPTS